MALQFKTNTQDTVLETRCGDSEGPNLPCGCHMVTDAGAGIVGAHMYNPDPAVNILRKLACVV